MSRTSSQAIGGGSRRSRLYHELSLPTMQDTPRDATLANRSRQQALSNIRATVTRVAREPGMASLFSLEGSQRVPLGRGQRLVLGLDHRDLHLQLALLGLQVRTHSGSLLGCGDDTAPPNAFIRICPSDHGDIARRIYWYSAKHHVLTMHYCFESLHDRLEGARQWASQSDRDATKENEIVGQAAQVSAAVDDLAHRLNSFNSLALYQLERIRVKYRPAGFVCSVPGVRNLFARSCIPLRTTTELLPESIRTASIPSKPPSRDQLVISSRYPPVSR